MPKAVPMAFQIATRTKALWNKEVVMKLRRTCPIKSPMAFENMKHTKETKKNRSHFLNISTSRHGFQRLSNAIAKKSSNVARMFTNNNRRKVICSWMLTSASDNVEAILFQQPNKRIEVRQSNLNIYKPGQREAPDSTL